MNLKEKLEKLKRARESRSGSLKEWEKKRTEFVERCRKGESPEGGELVNFLEGLTPDGYDRKGRKVSFIERGSQEKTIRLSK